MRPASLRTDDPLKGLTRPGRGESLASQWFRPFTAGRLAEQILQEPNGSAFLSAFPQIRSEAVRRCIVNLVLSLAANDDTQDPDPLDP